MLLVLAACGGDGGRATAPTVNVSVVCQDYSGGPGGGATVGNTTVNVNADCPKDSQNPSTVTPP